MRSLGLVLAVLLALFAWAWFRAAPDRRVQTAPAAPPAAAQVETGKRALAPAVERPVESARHEPVPEAPPEVDARDRWVVYGTVTGATPPFEPIGGAELRLSLERGTDREQLAEGRCATDGSYRIDLDALFEVPLLARPSSHVLVRVHAEGHAPVLRFLSLEELPPGEHRVDFQLEAGPSLGGRVLEPSGRPAVGALVMYVSSRSETSWSVTHVATDGHGEFVLAARDGSPARITASQDGFVPAGRSLIGWDLAARPHIGDLVLGSGVSISGRVVCGDGTPVPGLEVSTSQARWTPDSEGVTTLQSTAAMTDALGGFELKGLAGQEFEVALGETTFGPFPGGAAGLELTYPGRVLFVRVRDEDGDPLVGAEVEAALGNLREGRVAAEQWTSATARGPEGVAVLQSASFDTVILRVEGPGGHQVERLLALPLEPCFLEEDLIVPFEIPVGQVRVELRDPADVVVDAYRLRLESTLDGERLYDLEAGGSSEQEGPHEVAEGRYRAILSVGDPWTDGYLPVVIEPIEVRRGQVTGLERRLEIGGRVSLEVVPGAAGAGVSGGATVYLRSGHGPGESVSFFDGGPRRKTNVLEPGRTYLADRVFRPGPATFEVHRDGCGTALETVRIVSGEITELRVVLVPTDE